MAIAEWTWRWRYWVSAKAIQPGIYRLKSGGYLVRGRVANPNTHKLQTVIRALHGAKLDEARRALDAMKTERRQEATGRQPEKTYFDAFATSRYEAKLLAGDIKSAKGREKFSGIIAGHLIPEFGNLAMDEIRNSHLEAWRTKLAKWIATKYVYERRLRGGKVETRTTQLSPTTANTWISVLRTLLAEANAILELGRSFKIDIFDTSQRPTYTEEDPNALTGERAGVFLKKMKEMFPRHYAMSYLGFVTGKRPSTLRPLRRRGEKADVDWKTGAIQFRRSNTLTDETMEGTKTARHEKVFLPDDVMQVLREQVAEIETRVGKIGERQRQSELLFPSVRGAMRSRSVLDKPFAAVSKAIGLHFTLTPRGMRRTFNDLAREAEVHDIVARSISGHKTEKMQGHYSTAQAEEQRAGVKKIADVIGLDAAREKRKAGGA